MTALVENSGAESLGRAFSGSAARPSKKARPPILSLRLTSEERARLEREAAGMSLSAYARRRLFGSASGKSRKREPVKDHQALAKVLAALGRSSEVAALKSLLRACDDGGVVLSIETEATLRAACARIDAMRADLISALGLKPE